eukprot:3913105-Rhodomonas_salina.2
MHTLETRSVHDVHTLYTPRTLCEHTSRCAHTQYTHGAQAQCTGSAHAMHTLPRTKPAQHTAHTRRNQKTIALVPGTTCTAKTD